MFEAKTHEEDLIVMYLHRFDDQTGLYAHSTPIALCREEDLVLVLDGICADEGCGNYLLETVAWAEVNAPDRAEVSRRFLQASTLVHQTVWVIYLDSNSVAVQS